MNAEASTQTAQVGGGAPARAGRAAAYHPPGTQPILEEIRIGTLTKALAAIASAITAIVLLAPAAVASTAPGPSPLWPTCRDYTQPYLQLSNSDGRYEDFWVGTDHALWHEWEHSDGISWSNPASLGGYLTSCIDGETNQDGRLEIFGRAAGGDLAHIWQNGSSGTGWSGWTSLGGALLNEPSEGPQASVRDNGGIQVQVVGVDYNYHYKWQQQPNCCWTPDWH
jgi:hypothetical protein